MIAFKCLRCIRHDTYEGVIYQDILIPLEMTMKDVLELSVLHPNSFYVSEYKNGKLGRVEPTELKLRLSALHYDNTLETWIKNKSYLGMKVEDYEETESGKAPSVHSYNLINHGFHSVAWDANLSAQDKINLKLAKDLKIWKDDADVANIVKSSIFTVNGYAHLAQKNGNEIIIRGGYKTTRKMEEMYINCLNFSEIGDFNFIDFSNTRLQFVYDSSGSNKINAVYIYFNDNNIDFTKGQCILSMAGKLHFDNDRYKIPVFKIINSRCIRFNYMTIIPNINYFNCVNDLVDDNMEVTIQFKDNLRVPRIFDESYIKTLLKMPHTFIAQLNTTQRLKFNYVSLGNYNMNNRYQAFEKDYAPIRLSDGRFPAYMYIEQNPYTYIATVDNVYYEYLEHTTKYLELDSLTHTPVCDRPRLMLDAEIFRIQTNYR